MNDTLTTSLRFGWTTGIQSMAATYAAYTAMVSGEFPNPSPLIPRQICPFRYQLQQH